MAHLPQDASSAQPISPDARAHELREYALLALWRLRGALVVLALAPEASACKRAGNAPGERLALLAREAGESVDVAVELLARCLVPGDTEPAPNPDPETQELLRRVSRHNEEDR